MKQKEVHTHEYKETIEAKVPLRRYVKEDGKQVADTITGVDIVKIRKCKCGKEQAYDLTRSIR